MSFKKFRAARVWSNRELRRFAPRLEGSVVNVSAWRDEDKEGRHYRDYFGGDYTITNYSGPYRGIQGLPGELELDLSVPIEGHWHRRFDVVFSHTVLEHIYEVQTAFRNLCEMSRDVVIVAVPFLQEQHGAFDYWRFTPLAIEGMFRENGMQLAYLSANDGDGSIYLFAIGVRHTPQRFAAERGNLADRLGDVRLGCEVVK